MSNDSLRPTTWMQFSLRWSILLLTLSIVGLACYTWRVQQQRATVASITARGGTVWYDFEDGDAHTPANVTIVPQWLRRAMGNDWFFAVEVVRLAGSTEQPLQDTDLEQLGNLVGLKKVILADASRITVAGLRALAEIPSLEILQLGRPAIEAADLRHLSELPYLQFLAIETPLGDAGMAELTRFESLFGLEFASEGLTDAGMRQVKQMPELKFVEMQGNYRLSPEVKAELHESNPTLVVDDGRFRDAF